MEEVAGFAQAIEKMERETGLEPVTSSLGSPTYVGSKSLARFCCEFLNLQHLAESAFSKLPQPNEAQSRQALIEHVARISFSQPIDLPWEYDWQNSAQRCKDGFRQ